MAPTPSFYAAPAPRVAVRIWEPTIVTLAVGSEMFDLSPEQARAIALALVEGAQLIEGGPAYAAAIAKFRERKR